MGGHDRNIQNTRCHFFSTSGKGECCNLPFLAEYEATYIPLYKVAHRPLRLAEKLWNLETER